MILSNSNRSICCLAADQDFFMSVSQVIENCLRVVSQMITQMSRQLNHIQLKNKPTRE